MWRSPRRRPPHRPSRQQVFNSNPLLILIYFTIVSLTRTYEFVFLLRYWCGWCLSLKINESVICRLSGMWSSHLSRFVNLCRNSLVAGYSIINKGLHWKNTLIIEWRSAASQQNVFILWIKNKQATW